MRSAFFADDGPHAVQHQKGPESFAVACGAGRSALQKLLSDTAAAIMGCTPCEGEARESLLLELLSAATASEDANAHDIVFHRLNMSTRGSVKYAASTRFALLFYFRVLA